ITRLKTDKKNNGLNEIEMVCELLSLLGLKVVPKDYQSIDKERVAALLVMSKSWMNRIETVDDLFHDEISGQKEKLGY
ncbi:transcriptional regulator, partial [Acinetobacter baumannii]